MSASAVQDRHGIGGNNPPAFKIPSATEVRQHLYTGTEDMRERAEALAKMVADFLAENQQITTEHQQAAASDVAAQVKAHAKVVKLRFEAEKQPWTDGGRAVDAFFKAVREKLDVSEVEQLQTAYAQAVERQRRAAAAEEARRLQVEADRLAAEAVSNNLDEDSLDAAESVSEQAQEAALAAAAKPAELTRVHSDLGVTSSLGQVLVIELEDIALVPPEYRLLDESGVRRAELAAKKRGQTLVGKIPGVKLEWTTKIRNRG